MLDPLLLPWARVITILGWAALDAMVLYVVFRK